MSFNFFQVKLKVCETSIFLDAIFILVLQYFCPGSVGSYREEGPGHYPMNIASQCPRNYPWMKNEYKYNTMQIQMQIKPSKNIFIT